MEVRMMNCLLKSVSSIVILYGQYAHLLLLKRALLEEKMVIYITQILLQIIILTYIREGLRIQLSVWHLMNNTYNYGLHVLATARLNALICNRGV